MSFLPPTVSVATYNIQGKDELCPPTTKEAAFAPFQICLSYFKDTKANPDEKDKEDYNLQDNKEDMQVIDDVGGSASDFSIHDDIISNHSGSDFEEMSSVSDSVSRSRSNTPMSGSSHSRSRSGSKASSGEFHISNY